MSRRLAVVAALFAITACDRPTAPTSALSADLKLASAAGTKTNEWQPISGIAVNSCNGEDVFLSGSVHLVTTMSTTNAGTRFTIHENFNDLQGEGLTSGAKYHLNAAAHADQRIDAEPPFPYTEDEVIAEELVSDGPGDNLKILIIATFTFDGTAYSTTIKKMEVDCRG